MLNKRLGILLLIFIMLLTVSCADNLARETKKLIIRKVACEVGERVKINVLNLEQGETVSYSYDSDAIYIEDGYVEGMLAGQAVQVNAESSKGGKGSFTVVVEEDYYSPIHDQENWFEPINIDKIDNLRPDFPLGIDISTLYEVLIKGGKFYNQDGIRQNVYQILKDNGVNYVRIRLWNDPYNTFEQDGQSIKVPYGGGICDLPRVLEMAKSAKRVGLKILLDLHYSDFWAHPGQQVIPKAWKDYTTVEQISKAIYDFTYETIQTLDLAGAKPDMAQIGNEITSGMILQYPGGVNQELTGDVPYYISESEELPSNISGSYLDARDNLIKYVKAGNTAVKDYDPSILTMIHLAKGMAGAEFIKNFFNTFDSVDYDIIGLSYYPYHHGSINQLSSTIKELESEFPDKLITIAEISYGFTFKSHANAANLFSDASSGERPMYGYVVSPQGQADLLVDVISALAQVSQGYGIFYWEGCWIPVAGVGWADAASKNSWANQALFSYDGKALPSLGIFKAIQ